MGLNLIAIIGRVTGLGVKADAAAVIVNGVIGLIEAAETLYTDLKGSEKFAAVKAGVVTLVSELGLADDFEKLWKALAPAISLIVTIYNLKNLWPKPAQIGAQLGQGGQASGVLGSNLPASNS